MKVKTLSAARVRARIPDTGYVDLESIESKVYIRGVLKKKQNKKKEKRVGVLRGDGGLKTASL